ncbi:DUF6628 family protein [Parasphingopyxis sp.]|uniref:DUF6628 family protein n=1 Tax=Parasphingopyxis sp. TaxID=1920299 RepID=UPI0026138C0F|nr:DUF6628 family protein [Parasphingopyxis sp.]
MPDSTKFDTMLPHVAPTCGDARTLLFAIRRMAIHGIDDAFAVNAMIAAYGMRYRKPLLLLRTMLIDVARNARANIVVTPCCSPRMTAHEHALLSAIGDPENAATHLSSLIDGRGVPTTRATVAALGESLAALGQPLSI